MTRSAAAWCRGSWITSFLCLALGLGGCDASVDRLIADARALHDRGNFSAAVIKLKAALAQDPKNIPARLLAAQIYIDFGRGDAALGAVLRAREAGASEQQIAKPRAEAELVAHQYEQVIRDSASPPEGLTDAAKASLLAFRGLAMDASNRAADADLALRQALSLDPHSIDVRVALVRLAIARGDLAVASRQLAEAANDGSRDLRLAPLRGDVLYGSHDFAGAEQIFRNVLNAEPWNELVRGELAAVQVAQNKLPDAITTLDTVLKDPNLTNVPMHPILNYVRSVAAFRQHDYQTAQSNSEVVITRVPTFQPARLMASAASFALHEYERANYYLGPYVSVNPDDLGARKLLADIQLELSRPEEAAKILLPVRDRAANDPELLHLIGVAAARSGDLPTASRYLQLALDGRPNDLTLRTEIGVADVAAGDPLAAIENLQQIVKANPKEPGPQIPLFVAFMQTKEYVQALTTADQLIKNEPTNPTGELLAASVYLAQGDPATARRALLKARDIRHGDINVNRSLAKLALADGRLDEAQRYYQEIVENNPKSTADYAALAELDERAGRTQDAETALRKGIEANPADPAPNVSLLKLQLDHGETQKALVRGQQALKQFPRNPEVLDLVGRAQLALGQRDAALSTFKDLVYTTPNAVQAHVDLARAYLAFCTPDHPQWPAVNEATDAIKLDPHDNEAQTVLAKALIMHGRLAEANKVIDQLKTAGAENADVYELEGLLAQGQGQSSKAAAKLAHAAALRDAANLRQQAEDEMHVGHDEDAEKALHAWLDEHPDDTQTRKMWAEVLVKVGRLNEAHAQYADLVKNQPTDPIAQNNLAWTSVRLGKTKEAIDHARAAVALAPQSVDFLDTLGQVLLSVGAAVDAVDPLNKAWHLSADDRPDIGFHLSQALAVSGRKGEASALLHRLLGAEGPFADRAQAEELLRQIGG